MLFNFEKILLKSVLFSSVFPFKILFVTILILASFTSAKELIFILPDVFTSSTPLPNSPTKKLQESSGLFRSFKSFSNEAS